MGGFDLDAAQAVAGSGDVERYQVLDQLTLLVDKSLVVADDTAAEPGTGCSRRCANTPWRSSASPARPTPYVPVTAITTRRWRPLLDTPAASDHEQRLEQAEAEIDNLRAAFTWSRENSDIEALALASSLQPLWLARGRIREGLAWFDAALADRDADHSEVARVHAEHSPTRPRSTRGCRRQLDQAQQALAIAREVDDPALLAGLSPLAATSPSTTPRWPGLLRRGDRPRPAVGRPMAAQPDPGLAVDRALDGG